MAEFIDEKSAKAKGKRVSTLEIAKIEDITPEPEPEPEPEEEDSSEDGSEGLQDAEGTTEESSEQNNAIEVEGVTMTFEKPADTQLDLF